MKKIIFINSHPIQYFAPMYKYMNEQGLSVDAWYASEGSIKPKVDKEFGVEIKWDIPLLEGYNYRFFRNYSWKPSQSSGFFGLMNFNMILEIFRIPQSVIVVHGWHYFTHFMIIMFGRLAGHTICLRNETPLSHEKLKSERKQIFRKIFFKNLVFPRINYFLYIGSQNKLFYKSYDISDDRLISCPYAVDNERFRREVCDTTNLRNDLNIPLKDKIILFAAKYIDKKRPMDLLKAFKNINLINCWLIMVGEGKLREEMENYISQHQLKNVLLTGFVNQSLISQYYGISDVFVMCSTVGETWGLSVNEAMNYNLPVVISDLTGCSNDLVINGVNGYIFKTGNTDELANILKDVLFSNKLSWSVSSLAIIENYSYEIITRNIKTII